MNEPTTFLELLDRSSSTIHLPDGSLLTARGLADQGRVVAAGWRSDGLHVGDRVAVRLPNGRPYLEALAACAAGRFVLVSVNTRYSNREASDLIDRSGATITLDDSSPDRAVAVRSRAGHDLTFNDTSDDGKVRLRSRSGHEPTFDAESVDCKQIRSKPGHELDLDDQPQPDDPFLVFTTSGTTSKPKMVLHSQRSISVHAAHAAGAIEYRSDDVSLVVMPLCGTFGLTSLTVSLAANATIILADGFDATRTGQLIADRQVSVVNGSDDMFHRLVQVGADLRSVRHGGYARFNTSLDGIVSRAYAMGATVAGLYGMSEVQALFASRDLNGDAAVRSRAAGTLTSPQASYRIVDGELWLKGPSLFSGYLAEGGAAVDVELTAGAHTDGWFRTGDAAEADDDRTFTYITRLGDTLRLGGFLVAPVDIEQTILQVPGVEEAQVVAVDRPTGARPVAFVIAPGGIDEAAVIAHCASALAKYKVPVRIVVVEEFPTTPSANGNKIQNVKLRAMAAELLGPDIL